ncbi:MAG: polyhydroxyalkanoate depolymerase [Actinomycetota bacterium]|nr:polyhydroxyalkanoate depolymerase [Actinomycetota bacterium]
MLYEAYEARRVLARSVYGMAALTSGALRRLPEPLGASRSVRTWRALADTTAALELTHDRPPYRMDSVELNGWEVPVEEQMVSSTPFGSLVRFHKDTALDQPSVLIVPGLAGHFGTLVRGTIRTMLPDHDVYVADWHNARDVPVAAGRFGLDEYIGHIMDFLMEIGPGAHIVAVCQPAVATLAAAALMAEDGHEAQPSSITLIAGPVDVRVNPGRINRFAERKSLESLERTVITTVPWPHRGAGRRVYPGFLQVMGFMGMDPRRHASAFRDLFGDLARGNDEDADRTITFYDEYFAVLDVAAEFYLDSARVVFQDHDLARGCMLWRDRQVDPSRITSALLTVEGELDEMCCPGQTEAAHVLCTGVSKHRKHHHLQPGVGHYGVFNGSRFEREIYPEIRRFIDENDEEQRRAAAAATSA